MKNTTHRFLKFDVPTHGPHFDNPDRRWTTIVGELFAPIVRDRAISGFVFLNHEPKDVELRLACDEYHLVEARIRKFAKDLGITIQGSPNDGETIGLNAYHGNRWLSDDKAADPVASSRRSELVFRFLHAGCELLIDNLVPDGSYWKLEENADAKENPLKNSFETHLHLISNFSQAKFEVFIVPPPQGNTEVVTKWMTAKAKVAADVNISGPLFPGDVPAGRARCHL